MTEEVDTLKRPQDDSSFSAIERAVEWGVFLQSGLADGDDIQALQKWLAASAENKAAFGKIGQSWEDTGLVAMAKALEEKNKKHTTIIREAKNVPAPVARRWVLRSIAATMLFSLFTGVWLLHDRQNTEFQYTTAVGEIRTILLEDGTTITMGGASSVKGNFSSRLRQIQLNQGRAFFDVKPVVNRPFQVVAADSQVDVVGTAFDIELRANDLQVSVAHGHVNVSSIKLDRPQQALLASGERVNVSFNGIVSPRSNFNVAALSWRSGQLAYVDERLVDIITEINRYRREQIRIADPELNDLRVSFSVRSDQTDILLTGLEAALPVEIRGAAIYRSINTAE